MFILENLINLVVAVRPHYVEQIVFQVLDLNTLNRSYLLNVPSSECLMAARTFFYVNKYPVTDLDIFFLPQLLD